MAERVLAGRRIRDRRLDLGLRQAELAKEAGISPSYLNLIEHNRRRIGGRLLNKVADVLQVDPAALSDGAGAAVVSQMLRAAADAPDAGAEEGRAEELAQRFPGWSALIAALATRLEESRARADALSDRLSHDPMLATSLHEVLSSATSIRSAASILIGEERLDPDWQGRFHQNIHGDSLRLAEASQALMRIFEAQARDDPADLTPADGLSRFLDRHRFHFPALEEGGSPADVLEAEPDVAASPAGPLCRDWLERYGREAAAMPLSAFSEAALSGGYDPLALAAAFGTTPAAVLRRLASLPEGQGQPPIGLAEVDGTGALLALKPIQGFAMPRSGPGCALLPLYQALASSGEVQRRAIQFPEAGGQVFLALAATEEAPRPRLDAPRILRASMAVIGDWSAEAGTALEVGPACRICPVMDCAARREPVLVPQGAAL